ncbi:hypothetical protein KIN20_007011 [Parelaphostrongylus tenuis]|uniref:Uncharacterized protein n=1 Tax=Parelaphostrongylus tenuis TaxID=148309 RepID=A0AAD5QIT6_PARTN|nr:hypothetical protein KIN20_007011 [Parelaphostrongylus tenuis]
MKAIDVWMGSCMAFVFGVMIEFTICHFAKNQELIRCEPQPSLIVDTALSTLFGASRDIDDLRQRRILLRAAGPSLRCVEEKVRDADSCESALF